MTSRRRFLAMLGTAAALGAGAAGGLRLMADDEPAFAAEPELAFGQEACANCGMLIDDPRFAGAWIEPGNRQQHFDDIGCLVSWMSQVPPPEGTRYFVRNYADDGWLRGESAHFAMSEDFRTPMAYGAVAFENESAARRAGDKLGAHYSNWAGLAEHLVQGQGHMHGSSQ